MIYLHNYGSQELLIHVPIRSFLIFYMLELLKIVEDILSLILGLITTQRLQYLYNWNFLACYLRTLTALTISLTKVSCIHSESDTYQIDQTNSLLTLVSVVDFINFIDSTP